MDENLRPNPLLIVVQFTMTKLLINPEIEVLVLQVVLLLANRSTSRLKHNHVFNCQHVSITS